MKILCLSVVIVLLSGYANTQKFTDKYDNVNLDQILRNDRLLINYVNCLLDKGRCTADGLELKKAVPNALQNGCNMCSEKQRNGATKVIRYLIDNKRAWWNELEQKYDPQGNYRRQYEEEGKRYGVHL
uniref:Chemosensory protein n=1 Tax=Anoplophora chinensis TaxID=217632 RepID=A0A2H4ZB52_ANOCN|nr:chemosensory protein [Anoplophora chinensis]